MADDTKLPRRKVIAYGGSLGITTLAGCSGSNSGTDNGNGDAEESGDNETEDTEEQGDNETEDAEESGDNETEDTEETTQQGRVDATYSSYMTNNPEEMTNFNRWDPTGIMNWPVREVIFSKLAQKDTSQQEYIPYLAENWENSGDALSVTLREGQEWQDGTPFTSEDVVAYWDMTQITGSLPGALSEIRAEGDLTVEFVFENEVNPTIAMDTVMLETMHTPAHVFGDFIERYEDASDDDERDAILSEVQNHVIEDPHKVSNGMWKVSNKGSSRITYELHEPHFAASDINFTGWETVHLEEGQRTQAIQTGQLDLTGGDVTQNVLDGLPDHVREVNTNSYGGQGIIPNSEADWLNDYRVTQALLHILDQDRFAELGGPSHTSITEVQNTGVIPPEFNNMFSDEELDQLTDYTGQNTDAATELLENAGFEQSGDTWATPDGDPWELTIIAWAAEDTARTASSQLSDFGIESEVLIQDAGAIWDNYLGDGTEPWDLTAWGWGSPNIQGAAIWSYERSFHTDGVFASNTGTPAEIEIPWPAFDPDGTSPVNVSDLVDEYQSTTDEDEAMDILKQIAWAYNQYVPNLQLSLGTGKRLMSYDGWEMPEPDDPIMGMPWPPWTLLNLGRIGAE